jgi:hypothetical protein
MKRKQPIAHGQEFDGQGICYSAYVFGLLSEGTCGATRTIPQCFGLRKKTDHSSKHAVEASCFAFVDESDYLFYSIAEKCVGQ